MGIIASLTYNASLSGEMALVTRRQNDTMKAVAVSVLREGDHLAMLESQAWTITSSKSTFKKISGLGLLRFGIANDEMYRVVGRSESGELRAFDMPASYLVLRSVNRPPAEPPSSEQG